MPQSASPDEQSFNVLLIEDNPGDARLIQEMLRECEPAACVLTVADHLAAGCAALGRESFDIVLLDLSLPDSTGLATLDAVLQHAATPPDLPVVVLTGLNDAEQGRQAVAKGAQDYLPKDEVTGPLLVRTIQYAMERKRAQQATRHSLSLLSATLEGTADGILAVDLQGRITTYNQQFLDIWGIPPDAMTGGSAHPARDIARQQLADPDSFDDDLAAIYAAPDVPSYTRLVLTTGRIIERRSRPHIMNGQIVGLVWNFRDITARERAVTALRDSEARYRLLAEHVSDVIWTMDLDGRFTYVSPSVERLRGYTPLEVLQQTLDDSLTPASAAIAHDGLRRIRDAHAAGDQFSYQRRQQLEQTRKDGSTVWTEAIISVMYDESGAFSGILGVSRDISEQRAAQAALAASEHKLRSIIDHSNDGIVLVDETGKIIEWNTGQQRITGLRAADVLGHYMWDVQAQISLNDEDMTLHAARIRRATRSVLHTGQMPDHYQISEHSFRRADGSAGTVQTSLFTVPTGSGYMLGAIGRDVTELKRIERAVREQREFADALRSIASTLTRSLNIDTVLSRVLENVGRVVEHEAATILLVENDMARVAGHRGFGARGLENWLEGMEWPVTQDEILHIMAETRQPICTGDADRARQLAPTPELDWVQSYAGTPILLEDVVIGFIILVSGTPGCFSTSDSEHLQAFADHAAVAIQNAQLFDAVRNYAVELEERVVERTEALRRTTERIETILNQSSDAIIVTHLDGSINQTNPAFNTLFAYEADDPFGQHVQSLFSPASQPLVEQTLAAVQAEQTAQRINLTAQRRDGTQFDADVAISAPIMLEQNRPGSIVCSVRDVTQFKQVEENLRLALAREKELSELKSRFVSMVSHEFRTPLTTIQSSADLLREYMDRMDAEKRLSHLDKIQLQVRRLTSLLDDILTMSKMETVGLDFSPERLDLRAFCQDVVDEMRQNSGGDVDLRVAYEGDCHEADIDPKLLRHILNNLLSNAIKYSPTGSEVDFSVACDADQIVIRVSDSGIGIPSTDLSRLYQPFHRATNVGTIKGSGLGLAITKKSVDMHQGVIRVSSQVDKGTTFTVTLPTFAPGDTPHD